MLDRFSLDEKKGRTSLPFSSAIARLLSSSVSSWSGSSLLCLLSLVCLLHFLSLWCSSFSLCSWSSRSCSLCEHGSGEQTSDQSGDQFIHFAVLQFNMLN